MRKDYDMSQAQRGAIAAPDPRKTRITIRLDTDVLNWFRSQVEEAGSGHYQANINQALRDHIEQQREPLEDTLRKVLREELAASNRGETKKSA